MSRLVVDHRDHITLAREATEAGLVVTQLMPMVCHSHHAEPHIEYAIQLWCADGRMWAEGRNETADDVREHIRRYAESAARKCGPFEDETEAVRRD